MNTDELSGILRTLPPVMHGPADRFEAVERRARRRARTVNVAVATRGLPRASSHDSS